MYRDNNFDHWPFFLIVAALAVALFAFYHRSRVACASAGGVLAQADVWYRCVQPIEQEPHP